MWPPFCMPRMFISKSRGTVQFSALTKPEREWENTLAANKATFLASLLDNLGDGVIAS
jgi:hypothetical protein